MLPIYEHGSFPFYQIGIVSMSVGCAEKKFPDIYTNVQHYADWIEDNLPMSSDPNWYSELTFALCILVNFYQKTKKPMRI